MKRGCDGLYITYPMLSKSLHNVRDLSTFINIIDHCNLPLHVTSITLDSAAATGNLDIVKHLHLQDYTATHACMDNAAATGSLDIVRFLHDWRTEGCSEAAITLASANGHLAIVRMLLRERPSAACSPNAALMATRHNHPDILSLLKRERPQSIPSQESLIKEAVASGSLELVMDLMNDCDPDDLALGDDVLQEAIKHRSYDIARHLFDVIGSLEFTETCIDQVASQGDTSMLQYIIDRSSLTLTIAGFPSALSNGHLDATRLLFQETMTPGSHFTIPAQVADLAVQSGNLLHVQYIVERGDLHFTHSAMDEAASRGHADIVYYLHRHRSDGCSKAAVDFAASNGHRDIVSFLLDNRTESASSKSIELAAANSHADIVDLLLAKGIEPTAAAADNAAGNGDLAMFQRILKAWPGRYEHAVTMAAKGGHISMLEYLFHSIPDIHLKPLDLETACETCSPVIMDIIHRHYPTLRLGRYFKRILYRVSCHTIAGLKYLSETPTFVSEDFFEASDIDVMASLGAYNAVVYLSTHRSEGCTSDALDAASAHGHLNLIRYLTSRYPTTLCLSNALDIAIANNHHDIVQYLGQENHQ
eukprot:gene59-77_t